MHGIILAALLLLGGRDVLLLKLGNLVELDSSVGEVRSEPLANALVRHAPTLPVEIRKIDLPFQLHTRLKENLRIVSHRKLVFVGECLAGGDIDLRLTETGKPDCGLRITIRFVPKTMSRSPKYSHHAAHTLCRRLAAISHLHFEGEGNHSRLGRSRVRNPSDRLDRDIRSQFAVGSDLEGLVCSDGGSRASARGLCGVTSFLNSAPRVVERPPQQEHTNKSQTNLQVGGGLHPSLGLQIGLIAGCCAAASGWGLFAWVDARTQKRKVSGLFCFLLGALGAVGSLFWAFAQFR